jgi:hypothetical protein
MDESRGLRKTPRFESHALVEVRTSWWNPFSTKSAILIDISADGFKIEFVSALTKIKFGSKVRITIPLAPFGIYSSQAVILSAIVRWFDERNFRCGGVFDKPSSEIEAHLAQIVSFVASRTELVRE